MWKNIFVVIILVTYTVLYVTANTPIPEDRRFSVNPLVEEIAPLYRLPNNTRPIAYDISLNTRVDQNDFNFNGTVKIVFIVANTTSEITVHQRQLTILAARLNILTISLPFETWTYDSVTEFLTFTTEGFSLIAGSTYSIEIDYSGILRTDQNGFYRSSYVNEIGNTVYLATTKFETTNARHGFPCYDEPAAKAQFTLKITHGESYHAISNMPESRTINDDGTVTTSFEQTPFMSTYLVAYIVSDFTNISNYENVPPQFPHRSFVRPTANHLTNLTLEAGIKILDALETYVGVNYSLPKMDQAAIPDFPSGAMENWGLVMYRESYFLFDENVNTYSTKTGIVTVISHEFTHQWFGNLVSPRWWTYIWLNEGFATLFEYLATDLAYPDWHMMDFFIVDVLQPVFNTDASATIRPMTYYVESPNNVASLFDSIAYSKSGCVLRMMQNAFGVSTFQRGLNYYLIERQYSDAAEEDLFDGIERAVIEDGFLSNNYSVHQIMLSWTRQGGYPFIHVERNYNENTIRISQERYLTYTTGTIPSNTWWIPLNFATASDPDFSDTKADEWLPGNVRVKDIVPSEDRTWNSSDWIVFNKQQTGYYRVRYDRDNYKLIADELYSGDHERIHRLSRSQLIDDAFIFARTNRLDWDIPFDIIKYLQREIEYVPWQSTVVHLNYINRYMPGIRNYQVYRDFLGNLFGDLFDSVGIEDIPDEPHLRKYARTIAINWACTYGYSNCRQQANQRLRLLLTDNVGFHQNLQSVIYCAGLRNGTYDDYIDTLNRISIETSTTERNRYISAIGCISDDSILFDYLNMTLNTTSTYLTSNSERTTAFNAVYQNSPAGLELAIEFLYKNIHAAQLLYGSNNIGNAISGMAQRASNDNLRLPLNDLIELTLSMNYISVNTANNAYQTIFENVRWLNSYARRIEEWFDVYAQNI